MGSILQLEALVAVIRLLQLEISGLPQEELAAVRDAGGFQHHLDGPAVVRTHVYEAQLSSGGKAYYVVGVFNHEPVTAFIRNVGNAETASSLYALAFQEILDRG